MLTFIIAPIRTGKEKDKQATHTLCIRSIETLQNYKAECARITQPFLLFLCHSNTLWLVACGRIN